jgi:hypothetical protein
MNMMSSTATRRRTRLATVWILHQEGREAAGHTDGDRAWNEQNARRDRRGYLTTSWFNPVEINIAVQDIPAAIAKWERIAGVQGVCHADIHDRQPGDARNEFHP